MRSPERSTPTPSSCSSACPAAATRISRRRSPRSERTRRDREATRTPPPWVGVLPASLGVDDTARRGTRLCQFGAEGVSMTKVLVIYLMAGPDTPELAEAAVTGGADIVELGFPFSDPLADGP